ncbi:MAG: Holliday junction resolvase Hjc [Candidatus Nanoarchaeia archaeon]|nr:Holliday junction resolvase Hjc [Candidatus Nanoarchaeia archaeon]
MSKIKGTRAERELLHMFFDNGWMPLRAAGSGSTTIPAVDILTGNGKKVLAIECKSIGNGRKYFEDDELEQINYFAKTFGAIAIIGARFDNKGWFFLEPKDLGKGSGKNAFVSLELAEEKGLRFEQLLKKFN